MNLIFRRVDLWLPPSLLVCGILLRAEYLREYAQLLNFDVPAGPDVMEYDLRAREILSGRLFPKVPDIHAPLYPLFLALLYHVSNYALFPVRLLQLLLNFGAWIALTKLLERKGVNFKTRMIFLACAMFYPVAFFHQAEIISESLLLPFLTAVFWLLELADTEFDLKKRLLRMAGAGCAAGLAAVTHPLSLSFAGAVILYRFFSKARREALVFLAGLLLVIAPVVLIKSIHYGKLTGIQQNGGFNIWLGNNPDATGGCYLRPGPVWRKLHKAAAGEAEARGISTDRVWLEKSAKFWIQNPLQGMKLYLKKAVMVWSPAELIAGADPMALVYRTPLVRYGVFLLPLLMCFAVAGITAAIKNKERTAIYFFLLGSALYAAQILTVTSGRYRLAMLPALLYFAAYGISCFKWKKFFAVPLIVFGASLFILPPHPSEGAHEAAGILGEAAIRKNQGAKAFKLLSFAREGCNDPARIVNQLGMLLERSNDFKGAEKAYKEAAAGDPESMESFMNLGNLYSRFPAKHKDAQMYYKKALEMSPDSALLRYNYGVFLANTKRPAEAEKELLRALECDSSYHPAYNQLGIIALQTGRPQVAEKCFSAALELVPDHRGYRNNLQFVRNGNRSSANN